MSMTNKSRIVRYLFKELRQQKGSQRKVANDLGITEVSVRHIENGYFTPSAKLMADISSYFDGTPVEELFPDVFKRL